MSIQLELALLFLILDGIEQRPIVGRPCYRADAFHCPWKRLAGFKVFDVQSVLAKPGRVGGVCQPAAVVGYVRCADRKERMALCQLVSVEKDLFRRIWRWASCAAGFSAMNRVLQFLLGSRVIPPTAISKGNRYVGLLDVAQ